MRPTLHVHCAIALLIMAACDGTSSDSDASAASTAGASSDAGPRALRIGDPCKDRALPPRSRPAPQVVGVTGELLPDGAVRAIDAGQSNVDQYVFASTPVCLITADAPQGYFSWTCDRDQDCPSGAYCDDAAATGAREQAYCRVECASDAECSVELCCGDSTPLTCVAEEGVRGCRCEANCMTVYPFDGGAVHYAPSTCGYCDFWCCEEQCLNLANDAQNCGACGHQCEGDFPFCDNGKCGPPPCSASADGGTATCDRCCGDVCCGAGERCCAVPGPVSVVHSCQPADQPCPMGCRTCMCAAPDTPIETPDGERPIVELVAGDLVYSMEGGERVLVPLLRVNRTPVSPQHAMVRVRLVGGRSISMSPGHPTADGRTFGDFVPGDHLGQLEVEAVQTVPYGLPFTVDILPASTTGTYFAAGALVGSTLARE